MSVNRLLDDFVKACQPRRAKVRGAYAPRGDYDDGDCVYEAAMRKTAARRLTRG